MQNTTMSANPKKAQIFPTKTTVLAPVLIITTKNLTHPHKLAILTTRWAILGKKLISDKNICYCCQPRQNKDNCFAFVLFDQSLVAEKMVQLLMTFNNPTVHNIIRSDLGRQLGLYPQFLGYSYTLTPLIPLS